MLTEGCKSQHLAVI